MAFGCFTFLAASNAVLILTSALSLPLYLSFYGSEAAARFSLLLCIHAVLLASVPKVLKSALPMIQLILLILLLLLPFNLTPVFVVWCYETFLLLLDPVFSVIEVIQIVLVVMYISQSFVNEIDEQPLVVKSGILVVSGVSYLLSALLFCKLFGAFNTSVAETWIGIFTLTLSVVLFCICLYKDEGIISDAAVLTLLMSFIVWAIKLERLNGENPLEVPSHWLQ